MKCKHEASTNLIWRTDDVQYAFFTRDRRKGLGASWFGAVYGAAGREPDARWCPSCGAWLSLGPSNDADPNVAIEVRAAEIAADLLDAGCEMSLLEQSGFRDIALGMRGGGSIRLDTASTRSGYLARCIAMHDEER